jgi:two-component system, OmpR family, sensor kinase
MAEPDPTFARLVSLACHDLRTPLATVHGFARTLVAMEDLDDKAARYLGLVEAASVQLADLLDELGLAARIESGRWEPNTQPVSTLDLARAAGAELGEEAVEVDGAGGTVHVDV